jgi:hypothetical protein
MVDGRDVVDAEHLFWRDVTKHRDLLFCRRLERLRTKQSASDLKEGLNEDRFFRTIKGPTRSGSNPSPRREWIVVWVGLVFCSPCMSGTRDT